MKKTIAGMTMLAAFAGTSMIASISALASTTNYTVQPGDTLYKISQKTGVAAPTITSLNHITNPNMIYVGQTLNIPKANQNTSPSVTTGSAIAVSAKKYLGVPYVWGGVTPKGFDCSGFTQYVFQQNGISLPRNSEAQFGVGRTVLKSNLRPGDLVFFKGTYRQGISHVGIYEGNGKFIEESSGQGKVVIASLSNVYWKAHYAGAKRDD